MEALLAQDPAGKARLEKAKMGLARYFELTDEQQTKRSRTDDVENSDPGAAASAASGAGATSKAAAGHGTPAVAQQVEGSASGFRRRPFRVPYSAFICWSMN